MAVSFISFVTVLIYGATINHRQWVIDNSPPTGTEWLAHHVDTMLVQYQTNYLAPNNLPPVLPWAGDHASPGSSDPSVPSSLTTFSGISNENDLGNALRTYYTTVAGIADEIGGLEKAPFSYRYWGYVKFAWTVRERYRLNTVIPEPVIYDIDGTILSAIPFINAFNDLHQVWHLEPVCSPNIFTPTFRSTAGQMCGRQTSLFGQDFLDFHRDHLALWNRWYARTGQAPVSPINMRFGWPRSADAPNDPSTWTEPSISDPSIQPWINDQGQDTDLQLQAFDNAEEIGNAIEGGFHGSGHTSNSDIAPLIVNNFSPRFFAWHALIEHQRYWREPRFATWNFATHYRNRVFNLVQFNGLPLPDDFYTLTIVRDPFLATDYVAPLGVVNGLNLNTGAGNIKFRFISRDEYNRPLIASFTAELFLDVGTTSTLVETVSQSVNIGGVAPIALESQFDITFSFTSAFKSDDPARADPEVGFVNSRIKVTGTLEVADGSDSEFIHTDYAEVILVQEKRAPSIEPFLDISTFSKSQVESQLILTPTEARFTNALIVVLQDRTVASRTFDWPPETRDEVKGLITGYIPVSGIFDDPSHAPEVKIWRPASDTEFTGFRAVLNTGPLLEDITRNPSLPQRFTYFYDIVFDPVNDAFDDVDPSTIVYPRLIVPGYDRSGNQALHTTYQLSLTEDASPYMRDGATSWLSIDTRVLKISQVTGTNRFGTPFGPGVLPTTFITNAINNLNNGLSPETFDSIPTAQDQSVLEFSTTVGGTPVFNFALAKVRLQGISGANNVRAFFRLFSYSATNLVFDPSLAYRSASSGSTRIPLIGYNSLSGGASPISIPFFASARVPITSAFTTQTDPLNVKNFPASFVDEQVLYFGVYLDINQANARVPASLIAAHIDGPFTASEVQPIRNIIHDAHQCMVVEIKFDGNPTINGATPASSSNLAQRNLMILETDNPGSLPTHTVQHSFHVDLRKSPSIRGQNLAWVAPTLINDFQREKLTKSLAVNLRWAGDKKTDPVLAIAQKFPLVFEGASNATTAKYFDELLIRWPLRPYLPNGTTAEIYIPSIALGRAVNLRNVRHAPNTVRIVDTHTVSLVVPNCLPLVQQENRYRYCGVSYVPLPYQQGDNLELAGVVTIFLPDGIKEGTKWSVDVIQIRGGTQQVLGGFQVFINTTKARYGKMLDQDTRLLALLHQRLSLRSPTDIWHKVLQKRVVDTRARCVALAQVTDTQWTDPTKTKRGLPIVGRLVRVVVDQIWYGGRTTFQFRFRFQAATTDNGGQQQTTFYPSQNFVTATGCNTTRVLNQVIFEGWVETNLYVEVRANRTIQNMPTLPTAACACDAFCFPGQQCINSQCTTVSTIELPIYYKYLSGNIATFVDHYTSLTDVPNTLEDNFAVFWHIEYL